MWYDELEKDNMDGMSMYPECQQIARASETRPPGQAAIKMVQELAIFVT